MGELYSLPRIVMDTALIFNGSALFMMCFLTFNKNNNYRVRYVKIPDVNNYYIGLYISQFYHLIVKCSIII